MILGFTYWNKTYGTRHRQLLCLVSAVCTTKGVLLLCNWVADVGGMAPGFERQPRVYASKFAKHTIAERWSSVGLAHPGACPTSRVVILKLDVPWCLALPRIEWQLCSGGSSGQGFRHRPCTPHIRHHQRRAWSAGLHWIFSWTRSHAKKWTRGDAQFDHINL